MPRTLTVNVSPKLVAILDAVAAAHTPWATRHLVHRLALRLGLAQLTAEPGQVPALVQQDLALRGQVAASTPAERS